jgi:hypothetical protein
LSLFDKLIEEGKILTIKKVGIALSGLKEQSKQLSFDDLIEREKQPISKNKQKTCLSVNIDRLNKKYGKNLITIGYLPLRKVEFNPIAFAHIPD